MACSALSRLRHLGPVGEFRRHRVEHALQHGSGVVFVVEVVRHLLAVSTALAALTYVVLLRIQTASTNTGATAPVTASA